MDQTLPDAKISLESQGLHVRLSSPTSLFIAGSLSEVGVKGEGHYGETIHVSKDACALFQRPDTWIAVFPADGMQTYEVAGTLPALLRLITTVYESYRRENGDFTEAFRRSVDHAENYLNGRSLTGV